MASQFSLTYKEPEGLEMQLNQALRLRILELCREHDLTPSGLCDVSGINWSTLDNILGGRNRSATVSTIQKLCDGLGINLSDFFDSELFRDCE